MPKTFVLAPDILTMSPRSLFTFEDNNIVITESALNCLDSASRHSNEAGRNAKVCLKELESLSYGFDEANKSIPLPAGGNLLLLCKKDYSFISNDLDSEMISACIHMKNSGADTRLITHETTLRLKACSYGITVERYKNEQSVDVSDQYTGRCTLDVSGDFINKLYSDRKCSASGFDNLVEHEFVLFRDNTDPTHTALAYYSKGNFILIPPNAPEMWGVKPRNVGQRFAMEALMKPVSEAPLVILKGPAGTAKTFLSLAAGLQQSLCFSDNGLPDYRRILVSRPNIKFDEDIGFLKGSESEKIAPLIRPIYDNLDQLNHHSWKEDKNYNRDNDLSDIERNYFDRGIIVPQAMAYMRGRSVSDTFILLDEFQNSTPLQAFGIISRVGVGSKLVICGDVEQIDEPKLDSRSNGLTFASERMKGSPLCWQITFTKDECERSDLAAEAISRLGF